MIDCTQNNINLKASAWQVGGMVDLGHFFSVRAGTILRQVDIDEGGPGAVGSSFKHVFYSFCVQFLIAAGRGP